MDNCTIESNSIVAAGAVITQNTVVRSQGTIWAELCLLRSKDINQSDFAGELKEISNNYVMYSSWFKSGGNF
jgi:carbonic anhydrase/acetyltransferase-like protein (isoleucine patch superfamily)